MSTISKEIMFGMRSFALLHVKFFTSSTPRNVAVDFLNIIRLLGVSSYERVNYESRWMTSTSCVLERKYRNLLHSHSLSDSGDVQ